MATDAPEAPQKNHSEISPEFLDLRRAEIEGDNKPSGNSSDPRSESLGSKESSAGGFYNPSDKQNRTSGFLTTLKNKKKWVVGGVLGVTALVTIITSLFLGIGSLNLSNFMANVERKSFLRFQVDMDGRSSKWINAYMKIRMGEVEGGNPNKDNLYFKASRVDNNNPATDWYRTLRSSKFEDELFKKHNIQFQSIAVKSPSGNSIRFRTAMVFINDQPGPGISPNDIGIDLDSISNEEFDRLMNGDMNLVANKFSKEFDEQIMTDKKARGVLRNILKEENPHWWQAYKRHYLRLDMQNRLGIRKWTFFETKRNNLREGYVDRRNRVISKFIESSSPKGASQNFLNCLFGLNKCNAPADPANPSVAEEIIELGAEEAARRFVDAKLEGMSGEDAAIRAKAGVSELQGALDTQNDAWKAGNFAAGNADTGVGVDTDLDNKSDTRGHSSAVTIRRSIAQIMKRTNQLAILDALMQFHGMVRDGALSKIVTATKAASAMGVYSTFKIADDQMKTGEMNGDEFGDFMSQYGNLNNGEGWTTITGSGRSSGVSAASNSYKTSINKQEFCSPEHQEEMLKPENKQAAEREYQYLCPQDVVGSKTRSKAYEDQWNDTVGWFMNPLEDAYNKTPLGPINQVISTIIDKTFGAAVTKGAEIMGVMDNLETGVAFVAEKALTFGGANMNIDPSTPSGRMGNLTVQGGASLAEMGSRMSGAAITNDTTARRSTSLVLAYEDRRQKESGLYEKYLSLDSHNSFASAQIPALASLKYSSFMSSLSRVVGSIFSIPSNLISLPVKAATPDGYAASGLADIDTYDLPSECINSDPLNMTPASSTNADDLGYIPSSELTWSVMTSKTEWFNLLYEKVSNDEEKARLVWNCALFDNAVRGGIGGAYGYKGSDYFESSSGSGASVTNTAPTGNAQELASLVVKSGKVTGDPRYYGQLQNNASGDSSCPIDIRILTLLAGLVQDGHSLHISSLNRKCTNVLTASGVDSDHYRAGGGHAVDITSFNGAAVDGKNANTIKFLDAAVKHLPEKGVQYGQVKVCSPAKGVYSGPGSGWSGIPSGSVAVPDVCHHQHIGVSN